MSSRPHSRPLAGFIEPCLPHRADKPPAGPDWIHEIKHDGFRIMARLDAAGVRLLTRNGHDLRALPAGRRGGRGVVGALVPDRR
jgi:ATP-dependent DNA ligase